MKTQRERIHVFYYILKHCNKIGIILCFEWSHETRTNLNSVFVHTQSHKYGENVFKKCWLVGLLLFKYIKIDLNFIVIDVCEFVIVTYLQLLVIN